jgi:sugar phosphate isomerase/epimerase
MGRADEAASVPASGRLSLGIFAKTFERATLEEVFDAVAGHGLASVQFNMACAGLASLPGALPDAVVQAVRTTAERHGIDIAAVSGTYNMIHPDPVQRRAGAARLRRMIEAAHGLGTGLVTLCTGTRDAQDQWRAHPDNDRPEAWRDLIESLGEVLPTAERCNVCLGFEPEPANVVSDARKGRRLLDEIRSRHLRVVLDPANLAAGPGTGAARRAVEEALELLGGDVALAHAKDRGADGRVEPPGRGIVDFTHFVRGLRRAGFAGSVIMHGFVESDIGFATTHMRAAFAAAGAL